MAPLSVKDVVGCPTCGSREVVYTCEPKCCFNHLCSNCRTTFQLLTRKSTRSAEGVAIQVDEPASGDPAAACAVCESLKIAVVDENVPPVLVCSECHAALEMSYEDVAVDAR